MFLPAFPLAIDVQTVLVTIVAIVVIDYIYSQYIESTKDANDLYLNQQSIVEATRLPNESAIYKSNKLDHSSGLRVGLDIRYDHYKIRHGNLCDIWQIVMAGATESSAMAIDHQPHRIYELNYKIGKVGEHLQMNAFRTIKINLRFFLANPDVFAAVFGGFVNQVTVEFYDDFKNMVNTPDVLEHSLVVVDNEEQFYIQNLALGSFNFFNFENNSMYSSGVASDTFINEYSFTKDKGIALKITRKVNNKVLSTVEFTQLNIISAVASALKHLPSAKGMDAKDSVVIVNDVSGSNEHLLNGLTKLICGFVSNSQVHLINASQDSRVSIESIFNAKPTILSISDTQLAQIPIETYFNELSWVSKFFFDHKLRFLSKGKFSHFNANIKNSEGLRLIYVNKSLRDQPKFPLAKYNTLRCLFSTRVILESGYFNIIGPVVLTDFYDYRVNTVTHLKSYGCIIQAMEIKLINLNEKSIGNIMVRGYNIGKTTTWMLGISNVTSEKTLTGESLTQHDQNKAFMNSNNGFMTLNDATGIWGNDGCLYVV